MVLATGSVPRSALRVWLTLVQTPGEGMLAINTIIKAMREYPDFYWGYVKKQYTAEHAKVIDVINTVGGRPYYGFRSDLGPARSTLFPRYKHLAFRLCTVVGQENNLASAKTFGTSRVPDIAFLERLIERYVAEKREESIDTATSGVPEDDRAVLALHQE